jgi:hypothetical protein
MSFLYVIILFDIEIAIKFGIQKYQISYYILLDI